MERTISDSIPHCSCGIVEAAVSSITATFAKLFSMKQAIASVCSCIPDGTDFIYHFTCAIANSSHLDPRLERCALLAGPKSRREQPMNMVLELAHYSIEQSKTTSVEADRLTWLRILDGFRTTNWSVLKPMIVQFTELSPLSL